MVNLHLIVFNTWWILNERLLYNVLLFCLFQSESWPIKNKSAWLILTQPYFFAAVNLDLIVFCFLFFLQKRWTDGQSWSNLFVVKVNRGEDLRWVGLTAYSWQKWKRVFLTCPCHEMYRDEPVGLKSCKNTLKITIFVKMWISGQYREIWYCVNNCLIEARI